MKKEFLLIDIAFARSGDKNNRCNIGVCARKPEFYPIIKRFLTEETVKARLGALVEGSVVRYEWENIEALNFVCNDALDGGGSRSMRMDALGKNFSSLLLRTPLTLTDEEKDILTNRLHFSKKT